MEFASACGVASQGGQSNGEVLYSLGTQASAQYTSGNAEYLLPDALGSVRQIVDADGNSMP